MYDVKKLFHGNSFHYSHLMGVDHMSDDDDDAKNNEEENHNKRQRSFSQSEEEEDDYLMARKSKTTIPPKAKLIMSLLRRAKYEPIDEGPIGSLSGFGFIFRVVNLQSENYSHAITAMKVISCEVSNSNDVDLLKRRKMIEREFFNTLSSIEIYNVILLEEKYVAIEMQYSQFGDIAIFRSPLMQLPAFVLKNMLQEICYELKEIHSKNIIHRDIKEQNILINSLIKENVSGESIKVSLIDFGISERVHNMQLFENPIPLERQTGTRGYKAPELVYNDFSPKSDVYALGITFQNLCKGNEGVNHEFLTRLTQENVQERYSIENILEHIDDFLQLNERANSVHVLNMLDYSFHIYPFNDGGQWIENENDDSVLESVVFNSLNFNLDFNRLREYITERFREFNETPKLLIQTEKDRYIVTPYFGCCYHQDEHGLKTVYYCDTLNGCIVKLGSKETPFYGTDELKLDLPAGMTIRNNYLYVCDMGKKALYQIELSNMNNMKEIQLYSYGNPLFSKMLTPVFIASCNDGFCLICKSPHRFGVTVLDEKFNSTNTVGLNFPNIDKFTLDVHFHYFNFQNNRFTTLVTKNHQLVVQEFTTPWWDSQFLENFKKVETFYNNKIHDAQSSRTDPPQDVMVDDFKSNSNELDSLVSKLSVYFDNVTFRGRGSSSSYVFSAKKDGIEFPLCLKVYLFSNPFKLSYIKGSEDFLSPDIVKLSKYLRFYARIVMDDCLVMVSKYYEGGNLTNHKVSTFQLSNLYHYLRDFPHNTLNNFNAFNIYADNPESITHYNFCRDEIYSPYSINSPHTIRNPSLKDVKLKDYLVGQIICQLLTGKFVTFTEEGLIEELSGKIPKQGVNFLLHMLNNENNVDLPPHIHGSFLVYEKSSPKYVWNSLWEEGIFVKRYKSSNITQYYQQLLDKILKLHPLVTVKDLNQTLIAKDFSRKSDYIVVNTGDEFLHVFSEEGERWIVSFCGYSTVEPSEFSSLEYRAGLFPKTFFSTIKLLEMRFTPGSLLMSVWKVNQKVVRLELRLSNFSKLDRKYKIPSHGDAGIKNMTKLMFGLAQRNTIAPTNHTYNYDKMFSTFVKHSQM